MCGFARQTVSKAPPGSEEPHAGGLNRLQPSELSAPRPCVGNGVVGGTRDRFLVCGGDTNRTDRRIKKQELLQPGAQGSIYTKYLSQSYTTICMTSQGSKKAAMVVLFVLDGLRPEFLSALTTPFLARQRELGTCFDNFRSVFPSATRVCAATVATGCYPDEHGITENEFLVRREGRYQVASCSDAMFLSGLPVNETGSILGTGTLAQKLKAVGKRFFSACSGSSGTTYLTNPAKIGACVNWEMAWPDSVSREIQRNSGFPSRESSSDEKNAFIIAVAERALQSAQPPDVCLLWFTEPDETQHNHGIGSKQALHKLRLLDRQIEAFHDFVRDRFSARRLVFFALSDHGCVTPQGVVDPIDELVSQGLKSERESQDIIVTSNSFFVLEHDLLRPLVMFLSESAWVESVFVRNDVWQAAYPARRLSELRCSHPRAAEVMVSYTAEPGLSDLGIPGTCMIGGNRSAHGSASDYEMGAPLIIWGEGIEQGAIANKPCDLTDIAPSIMSFMGLESDLQMDGTSLLN